MHPSTLLAAPVLALALTWVPSLACPGTPSPARVVADPAPVSDEARMREHPSLDAPRAAPAARPVHRSPRVRPRPPAAKHAARHRVVARTPQVSPAQRAAEAFASLRIALPSRWTIRFERYTGRYQGLTTSDTRTVTIWARPSDSRQELRITIAHELGHVLDFTTLTRADQQRYLRLRGRGSFPVSRWYPSNGTSDYASPAGDFAEVYALWTAGAGDFRSTFAPQPTSSQLQPIAQLFRELRARQR